MSVSIIIVDDDVHASKLLQLTLAPLGLDCIAYNDPVEFLKHDLTADDIVLLDLHMPNIDGVEVIRTLGEHHCPAKLILISGYDKGVLHSAEQLAKAHHLNFIDSLIKPINIVQLREMMQALVSRQDEGGVPPSADGYHPTVTDLVSAISNDDLVMHYQPQIDIQSGELVGAETLVRWQHPEQELIQPNRFVPLAEQNGLMIELTASVLTKVIEQTNEWHKQNLNTQVSVNVSADNVTRLEMPERLFQMVNDKALAPSMLMLEMTESALMGELPTSLDNLTRLRMKGFGLSIDDFGTGYSSMIQLHRAPFSELKIDQSFVKNMDVDHESYAIVKTCIMLGHELGMKVVAEGVEKLSVLSMLADCGCDIAQGYYFARPMVAAEFKPWVDSHCPC